MDKFKHGNNILGVDVSHYETGFDFVKGVSDGVVFMMTKASESRGVDSTCARECAKARAAGVKYIGAYHFFHSSVPIADQWAVYERQIRNLSLEMPPILDLEETSIDGRHPIDVKNDAHQWLELAEKMTGKVPLLYTNQDMTNILGLDRDSRFNKYPRWVARYNKAEPSIAWTFWQFTDKGEQGADTNWFHGTEDDLKKFLGIA